MKADTSTGAAPLSLLVSSFDVDFSPTFSVSPTSEDTGTFSSKTPAALYPCKFLGSGVPSSVSASVELYGELG